MIRNSLRVVLRAGLAASVLLALAAALAQADTTTNSQDGSSSNLHWLPGKPPEKQSVSLPAASVIQPAATTAPPAATTTAAEATPSAPKTVRPIDVAIPVPVVEHEDPRPTEVRKASHAAEPAEVVPKPAPEPARGAIKATPPTPELVVDSSSDDEEAPSVTRHVPAQRRPAFAPEVNELPGLFDDDDMEIRRPFGMQPGMVGACGDQMLRRRIYGRVESLLWWTKGFNIPPLLTTSPPGTDPANSGVLGLGTTSILLGNGEADPGFHAGGRVTLGGWLDLCQQTTGVEVTFVDLGEKAQHYDVNSNGDPILARPFFDVGPNPGGGGAFQDAHIFASLDPAFLSQGQFRSVATSDFWGLEILMRRLLTQSNGYRVDMLAGFRYAYLQESLRLYEDATFDGTANGDPAGGALQASLFDEFATVNRFYGGELGLSAEFRQNRWTLENTIKLAVGETMSRTSINGATTTTAANGTVTTAAGGFLALPSNIGDYNRAQTSFVPEFDGNLGFNVTPRLKFTLGYTLMYWSRVTRPGDQIDTAIDPSQAPIFNAGQPVVGPAAARPVFEQRVSDYWAQGLNVGMDFRY